MPSMAMLLGRLLLSAIFIQAGFSKLLNVGGTIAYFESVGMLLPSVVIWPVIALEVRRPIAEGRPAGRPPLSLPAPAAPA